VILVVIGTIAIVAATIAIGVLVDRKISLLPRPQELLEAGKPKQPRHDAGEAPATAIRARGAQLDRLRRSRRCPTCREPLVVEGDDECVRYDDRELLVIHLRCTRCNEPHALYVLVE
jgi:hypothetical protein